MGSFPSPNWRNVTPPKGTDITKRILPNTAIAVYFPYRLCVTARLFCDMGRVRNGERAHLTVSLGNEEDVTRLIANNKT